MFTITKEFRFEAAHKLPKHDGKCQRLHGHSWRMRVVCVGQTLHDEGPKSGMLLDFGDVSKVVKPLVEEKLDHYHLNESTGLENPTSEELAQWIFSQLKPILKDYLVAVEVDETCTSSCRFQPTFNYNHSEK
jgi:6-pyruvoyltetrahydropterin/6-carboxytetrahydropterin synthase